MAVRALNIEKRFGDTPAVRRVSFDVPEGSFTTLLGASGSGKTTTLRLLAGLEPVDEGEIRIGSKIVDSGQRAKFVPPERRDVGLVFQSYALWPHMTIFDQVAYPLKVRGQNKGARERVRRALAMVGLEDLGRRYPSELSGGQQQRVALARAVVYEPRLLLLDEPLSNLDAELREHMRREIHDLHRRLGITTVYVTHDQVEALSLSTQIVVMSHGRIIDRGTPREIYDSPKSVEVASFVGHSNVLPGKVVSVAGALVKVRLELGAEIAVERSLETPPPALGSKVVVAIKPEDMAIGPPTGRDGAVTQLDTVVENSAYVGAQVDIVASLRGAQIRIRAPKSTRCVAGEHVVVTFPHGAICLIQEGVES